MAQPILKAVKSGGKVPARTLRTKTTGTADTATVTVKGAFAELDKLAWADIAAFVPDGYCLNTANLEGDDDGLGTLRLTCVAYSSGESKDWAPVRTTFRVTMAEVKYDLEDHPHLAGTYRDIVLKWLATDEAKRVVGETYSYTDETGAQHQIDDERAKKFIKAYLAGITTFSRFYPVVEKVSTWKNPPGLSRDGRSFTGGSPKFSANIGKWDDPPITLNGFGGGHWFKSDDSWAENGDGTWQETEQWTYTPEGSAGEHAWIYSKLDGEGK